MLRKAVMITAALALGSGAVGVGVTPSGAEESGTHCFFEHVPDLNPGLSYEPSSGTFTDPGGGSIECHGEVAGNGTYTDSGRYGTADPDTCQGGGEAEGDPTFTIETAKGPQTFTDHIKIKFGEPSTSGGVVHATFEGEKTKGTIELTPTKGDCISSPVTQVKGVGEFHLK